MAANEELDLSPARINALIRDSLEFIEGLRKKVERLEDTLKEKENENLTLQDNIVTLETKLEARRLEVADAQITLNDMADKKKKAEDQLKQAQQSLASIEKTMEHNLNAALTEKNEIIEKSKKRVEKLESVLHSIVQTAISAADEESV